MFTYVCLNYFGISMPRPEMSPDHLGNQIVGLSICLSIGPQIPSHLQIFKQVLSKYRWSHSKRHPCFTNTSHLVFSKNWLFIKYNPVSYLQTIYNCLYGLFRTVWNYKWNRNIKIMIKYTILVLINKFINKKGAPEVLRNFKFVVS